MLLLLLLVQGLLVLTASWLLLHKGYQLVKLQHLLLMLLLLLNK